MLLCDCVQDYAAFIKHEQGVAKSTYEGYVSWLRYLLKWMQANGYAEPSVADFNTAVLRRFLYHLSGEKQYRPRTIRGIFFPIKGLARFLMANRVLTENPVATIQMPKKDAAVRLTITDEEIKALMDACEKQRNAKQTALARALFSLLIYAGLRRQELLDLHTDDVNAVEGSVLVRSGKGSKSRTVYVPPVCIAAVQEWLVYRPQNPDGWLFAFDTIRRLHERGLRTIFEAVTAVAGMRGADNIKPHSIRHWRATDLMKSGADLKSIQAFLGHQSLQVTQIYLHTDSERCRQLANLSRLQPQTPQVPQDDGKVIRLPQRDPEHRRLRRISAR